MNKKYFPLAHMDEHGYIYDQLVKVNDEFRKQFAKGVGLRMNIRRVEIIYQWPRVQRLIRGVYDEEREASAV